ncbi:uncharacterized protein LOC127078894 [Lathyrus oleraceus]|uniref:uncharacterized protein LOC127078894 n=1 Tax=Pisum sativum TaxID=3888 RepID=UPI0021CEF171|nr:uncharacterized protein LOC127078894 [Pisum sativum]
MDCERGGNYKRKNASENNNSSKDIYSMKVKCPFRLRYVANDSGWKVMIRCGLHNHKLSKNLDDHDILGLLKDHERQFVNDMTKYNMAQKYIVTALKDKDPDNFTSVIQVYKATSTYNMRNRGSLTELQMLLSLIHREKYICWTRNMDDLNVIVDIF